MDWTPRARKLGEHYIGYIIYDTLFGILYVRCDKEWSLLRGVNLGICTYLLCILCSPVLYRGDKGKVFILFIPFTLLLLDKIVSYIVT